MASGQSGLLSWTIERTVSGSEVTIAGEVDLAVVEPLRSALDGSVRMSGLVTLDLRDVSFIDSTGLRLLLDLKRKVDGAGGGLVLMSVSDAVERVLEVTGTAAFFEQASWANVGSIADVAEAAG